MLHYLLEKTGQLPRLANKKQGAEETKQEQKKQSVGDLPVVGFDKGSLPMFNKNGEYQDCDERQNERRGG